MVSFTLGFFWCFCFLFFRIFYQQKHHRILMYCICTCMNGWFLLGKLVELHVTPCQPVPWESAPISWKNLRSNQRHVENLFQWRPGPPKAASLAMNFCTHKVGIINGVINGPYTWPKINGSTGVKFHPYMWVITYVITLLITGTGANLVLDFGNPNTSESPYSWPTLVESSSNMGPILHCWS